MIPSPSSNDASGPETPTPRSEIDRLLADCLDQEAAPRAAVVERICGEHPELAPALRKRLRFLERVGLVAADPGFEILPEEFGAFRLLSCLGRGGMGVVHLAEQPSLGRRVALKLIRTDYLHFPGSRERFRREALAASRLDHPNICPIYEAGEAKGVPYIAMRCVEGQSLAQRITESRSSGSAIVEISTGEVLGVASVVLMAEKLARALHVAHEAGLVHRDIKPGNLLIGSDGEPVILDFGLARDSAELGGLMQGSEMLGTPAYTAPEQIQPHRCRVRPPSRSASTGLAVALGHPSP